MATPKRRENAPQQAAFPSLIFPARPLCPATLRFFGHSLSRCASRGYYGIESLTVGQHTLAVAFLVLYWASFRSYPQDKRDRLVTLALVHDAHEAVVGDILPYFKTQAVREAIDAIQRDILHAFAIVEDQDLHAELKLLDKISFLYEISRSSPKGIDESQRELIALMATRQREEILRYAEQVHISLVEEFLQVLNL